MVENYNIKIANILCKNTTLHTLSSFHVDNENIIEIAKNSKSNYIVTTIVFSIKINEITDIVERNKNIIYSKRFIKTKQAVLDF